VAALFAAALLSGNFEPHSHLLISPLVAVGTLALAVSAAAGESADGRAQRNPSVTPPTRA